ncbi:Sps19p [Sugiyamaella lignohabitans]|uniref:2,4-dienoyl-CoA reductase [(3E)-enoyl-CoA-producing] n=1 Tax=Sugiyamaella lignohabitans TaxID=796027 RepID=A0A167CRD2_9ASCO|nr:Sps19p [Sugiyamaella lignohabitans]ANB12015.1 Sps19p [Sugiyamaella lignohabitans]
MPNTLGQSYLQTSPWKKNLFDGKVVFVTGGAGSICRVEVEALVLLGANAAIIGRRKDVTEKAAEEIGQLRPGAKVIGIGGVDVRDVKSLASAVDTTVGQLGRIDFVIAGAAGNFLANVANLSANAFKTVVDIDLLGSYNTFKATFDELRKNKGHIIFISATLHYTGLPMQVHASAAKAGVDSLMRTLAVELGPLGIRSNAIAPGPIAGTEGMDRLSGKNDPNRFNRIPLQRYGTTTEIADATVYLFSDASSYITGTVTVVDGGSWQTGSVTASSAMYPTKITELNSKTAKL